MLSKIKEAGRQVARSNSVSNDSRPGNLESQYYTSHIADKRRYSAAVTDALRSLQHSPVPSKAKMDKRPPLRKRGSSLFNKMTSQETYESLVPRSTSSSRLSERTITDNRDSTGLSSLSTRIKAHRMRKNSQLSLSLGPLEEHEIRQPGSQPRAPPKLLRTHSVPDLLSRSQAMSPDSRKFCNGKPISNPFNFRHLSHMETRQTAQFEDTPEDVLPIQWNSMVRESRAPRTPVVPLTPLTARGVRHMQSLSGSLRTSGLPMPSPSIDSVYSPVESIADLSMGSKSAESLNNSFPSYLAPPPRSSSRTAFTGPLPSIDDDIPILESEGRDSVIFLQDDLAVLSRTVGSIPEESSLLDQEVEDDVLGAFPSPPITSSKVLSLKTVGLQPNIVINNHLLPPLSPLRPSSSSSGTLGFGAAGDADAPKEQTAPKRSSKRMSKRLSRRVSILGDAQAEIQSWEADIDWTYDNNGFDEWVDDLEGIEEEEEADNNLGSKSAPVSASPSTVNLASLAAKRHSDEGKSFLAAPEEEATPRSPEIGIADGGFGIFDHADRQYNAFGHQRQLSKTRNGASHSRTLSTCASLPNLKAGRKHYRNSSLRGFSNLDNGIVTLDEEDEIQHPSFQRMHSAPPREVAIPPARYSGRSRAASNATCTTLVSDIEGYPSDLSEMASTPSHSSHNSTEGPYFLSQTQDGLFFDLKTQLGSGVHIVNDEVPFNFF
ncbi:hypothetical protein TWF970_007012 [Orbilia oligospora]|uniref:CRIB domain-containing protein n=1 Tax=Orbilia oligospora TaxID=2813651 RepID=A0A7C8RJR0_ORBOL|nr:hypothetical protein TWF970_007012 [Orbilia oligospora]KAF3287283.1 hypothetical protein TWF970_007012 [Orbilia oligospora]